MLVPIFTARMYEVLIVALRACQSCLFFLSLTDPLKSLLQIANESYLLVRQDTPRFIEHRPDTGSGSETS